MELKASYKLTEVGVIPDDWEIYRLVDVAHIKAGIAKNTNAVLNNAIEVPYLRVANVQDGYLNLTDVASIRIEKSDLTRFSVLPDDLLMNEGGDIDKLGRGALWSGEISTCVHQNHVFVVRCKKIILPKFLNAWTSSKEARRYFLLAGRQTTNLASINKSALGELPVPIPNNFQEQQAIATALSDTDALIESLEHLIAKKRLIKQGTMQELLTGKRRLPGFSGEWEVKRLGELADMGSGGTPPSSNSIFYDGDIPWVAISDMTKGGKFIAFTERNLTNEGFSNCAAQMFPAGTVLYAMYASLGECSIASVPLCSSQAILGIRVKERLSSEFIYYYFQSIKSKVKTLGQQGTQANLNKGMVKDFVLLLPPVSEQTAIATLLSDLDTELTALESQLEKTRAIKQGMMQSLLTGRIRLLG